MSVFYATRFSSAGSPNEYANGCSSVGSVNYANKNTSLSHSSDAVVLYTMWPIALPVFLPCFTPSTNGFNPTEMQISYIWTTYVSSSDLRIAHIRAAWPITAQGIKLWMRHQGGAWTTNYMHTSYIRPLYHSHINHLCHFAPSGYVEWRLYGDKLQKEIRNSHFIFASGSLASLFVPVIAVMGQRHQWSPNYELLILPLQATVKLTAPTTDSAVHPDIALLWLQALCSLEAQSVGNDNHTAVFV